MHKIDQLYDSQQGNQVPTGTTRIQNINLSVYPSQVPSDKTDNLAYVGALLHMDTVYYTIK